METRLVNYGELIMVTTLLSIKVTLITAKLS